MSQVPLSTPKKAEVGPLNLDATATAWVSPDMEDAR